MLKAGVMLGNRYEIIECIGSGGMANVYKALDHMLNRFVAIKVMKSEFSADNTFITKFREEAQSAAGFSHPNIVSIYDVGQEEDLYYIVMELVEGITLKSYIERKKNMTVREATSIAIQISMGMEAAHNQHIVHRDIKPQNVIISREGKAKITDFGIARASGGENKNSEDVLMGSIHYTAPELIQGGDGDEKSDIYSLGITIFEMLTGAVPFDGKDTVSIAMRHIKERMPFIRVSVPEVPLSLEAIVQKCTEKRPKDRYQGFVQLIKDLKQSLVTPDCDFINGELIEEEEKKTPVDEIKDEVVKEEKKEKEKSTKFEKTMTVIGICAAVIIVGLAVFVGVYLSNSLKDQNKEGGDQPANETTYNSETQRQVINVLGMTYDEARQALNNMNLGIHLDGSEESDEYEAGQIMWQGVEEGDIVDVHTTIHVKTSSGSSEYKELPSVVGLTAEEAIKVLKDYDITAKETAYEYSDTVEVGCVISQTPEAGTAITPTTDVVELTISRGTQSKSAKVPNVKGISQDEAKDELERYGFEVVVVEAHSNSVEAGYVISQNYEPETVLAEGASVTITVSLGKEGANSVDQAPVTTWTLTAPELPDDFTQGKITLELKQTVNGNTVTTKIYEGTLFATDLPYVISIKGEPEVETGEITLYLDDNLINSYTISF